MAVIDQKDVMQNHHNQFAWALEGKVEKWRFFGRALENMVTCLSSSILSNFAIFANTLAARHFHIGAVRN